ncbi:hypothetical protein PUR57_21135 [Streptomyces sp. JV176]|uniref:hypothetical protein n=1 Tax=Streptomyces sp. JV176 TaxID=858630 RepID=UPI002E774BC3|nr:hypothetical protein [Streptomyces sp. JV176]MEE1801152.1 hypothetical protein [Streptomyces sp. JV176]
MRVTGTAGRPRHRAAGSTTSSTGCPGTAIEHACLADPSAYALMAEYGTFLVPTQYVQTYFLARLDDESLQEEQPPKMRHAYRRYARDLREGLRRPAGTDVRIAFGTDAGMFPYAHGR